MNDKIYSRSRIRLPKIELKNKENNRNTIKILKIIVILGIAINFAYFSLKGIKPIMEKNCISIAKSEYDDILNIIKDENGNIKMVGTNIFTVNKIISDIPVYMQEEFEREENSTFKIPIGSFFGSKLFSGRGPKVNIKMQIVGDLDTDLRSEFTSAGINQTLHRIYLEIKCNVVILTPFETIEQKISNQVLLAEGVIVGEIPNSYYNLEGISKDNAIDIIE